jgi:hypothetical protein
VVAGAVSSRPRSCTQLQSERPWRSTARQRQLLARAMCVRYVRVKQISAQASVSAPMIEINYSVNNVRHAINGLCVCACDAFAPQAYCAAPNPAWASGPHASERLDLVCALRTEQRCTI